MNHQFFLHRDHNTLKIVAGPCGTDLTISYKTPKEKLDPKATFHPMGMQMVRTSPFLSRDDIIVATPRNDPMSWFSHQLIQVDVNALSIILHYRNIFSGIIDRLVLSTEGMPPEQSFFEFMLYGSAATEDNSGVSTTQPIHISMHKSLHSGDLITEVKTFQTIAVFPLPSALQNCKKILSFSSRCPYALGVTINTD